MKWGVIQNIELNHTFFILSKCIENHTVFSKEGKNQEIIYPYLNIKTIRLQLFSILFFGDEIY
jgi:hypothetical protein